MKKSIILLLLFAGCFASLQAQLVDSAPQKSKKAWEIGLGGTVFQFSRISFSDFSKQNGNYTFDMNLNHAVWGGGIYAARELNRFFYADFQGSLGFTNKSLDQKNRFMFMGGLGLQYRFGEHFGSKYIEPYLRAGINYMYKDFNILYTGNESIAPDEMKWVMENYGNKDGRDKKHLMPITLGGGVNMWLNDHFGIGMQADYVIMPYKHVANSLQGSVRLLWRIGGKSKKTKPKVEYVDREVEKIVERVVEKEVVKEKTDEKSQTLYEMINQIYFDFDKYAITEESRPILDNIADFMKQDTSRHYLITGQTDARGSVAYNINLSKNRANTVLNELIKRGVPANMIKARGVGKSIAEAAVEAPNDVRRGDRKITIELVTNDKYWNILK